MTFINVTIDQWELTVAPWFRLTVSVGGCLLGIIEHTFENRVILMMQEVLL